MAFDSHKGVQISNEMFTGQQHATLPTIKRAVAQLISPQRGVTDFYFGVASGADYLSALKSRLDARKRTWGVSHMYLLYGSGNETNKRKIETALIGQYRQQAQDQIEALLIDEIEVPELQLCHNLRLGGGGRKGASGNHFLYLACRRPAG